MAFLLKREIVSNLKKIGLIIEKSMIKVRPPVSIIDGSSIGQTFYLNLTAKETNRNDNNDKTIIG